MGKLNKASEVWAWRLVVEVRAAQEAKGKPSMGSHQSRGAVLSLSPGRNQKLVLGMREHQVSFSTLSEAEMAVDFLSQFNFSLSTYF